jgi:molecular chaperone DnaK
LSITDNGVVDESLNISTFAGRVAPIIERGTPVPSRVSKSFSTASDNQTQIIVTLYRGTAETESGNQFLGKYQVVGIPPLPRGVPMIDIEFTVSKHGEISLRASDREHKSKLRVEDYGKPVEPSN